MIAEPPNVCPFDEPGFDELEFDEPGFDELEFDEPGFDGFDEPGFESLLVAVLLPLPNVEPTPPELAPGPVLAVGVVPVGLPNKPIIGT
jgi:hypothetical protein